MALIFFDGFDAGDAQIKWSSSNGGQTSTTTRYGVGRSWTHTGGTGITKSFTAVSQVFVGFAYLTQGAGTSDFFAICGDAGATTHLTLRWPSSGTLGLYRGGSSIATASVNEPDQSLSRGWAYVEVSATIADAGGTCVVKIDGTTVINFTGDTKNSGTANTVDTVKLLKTGQTPFFDDFYVLDSTGSTNNTFLGEVKILTVVPSGAGASTQWTPSSGANYTTVDELPYSASDYITDGTSGHRDTYAMGDLTGTPTVLGVQTCVIAKKSDAGAISAKNVVRSGGTNYYGSSYAPGTSDATFVDIRELNPATSAAWTASNVNAIEAGVEVV